MKSKNSFLLFLLGVSFLFSSEPDLQKAKMRIEISNLKHKKGQLFVKVVNTKDSFLSKDTTDVFANKRLAIDKQKKVQILEISDVPFGEYAIILFHDENSNGKMDSNFIGIPKEGYGLSNNKRPKFGPPKYDDCKFHFSDAKKSIQIILTY